MSRAVEPAVREKARTRTCPDCRALPGEKCAPDRAGRSQLHGGRIQAARRTMAPLPMHQILPDTGEDRRLLPLDADSVDTLMVSLHPHLLREFSNSPYEAAALLWLVLLEAKQHHPEEKSKIRNFQLGFMAAPAYFLTPGELREEVDLLAARGVVERVGDSAVRLNPAAVCLLEYRQVPARRRLEWNAERTAWAGSAMPTFPSA